MKEYMTTTLSTASIDEKLKQINEKYKSMQRVTLKVMVHPDATPEVVHTCRQLLLQTASALSRAQSNFTYLGYELDKLEGVAKQYKL